MKDKLKFIFRVLRSNRLCSIIGILGLGLGLACTILISKYIWQEYTSNCFHKNYDRLYYCISYSSKTSQPRIGRIINWSKEITDYPEVEHATEFQMHLEAPLEYNRHIFPATIFGIDSSYYKVFSFRMKIGQLETALADLSDMVVTESFARKVFGKENPVGKEITYQGIVYKITGVVEDWPANSSFRFDVLLPSRLYFGKMGIGFLTLKKGADIRDVNEKLEKETLDFLRQLFEKVNPEETFSYHFLEDEIQQMYENDRKLVRITSLFTFIAIFISSMGLFGFVVFDIRKRFMEIGVRKVNGATNGEVVGLLLRQFLSVVLVSFIIAAPIAWLVIYKYRENFAEKAPLTGWLFAGAALLAGTLAFLTVFRLSYKAAVQNPVKALKNE